MAKNEKQDQILEPAAVDPTPEPPYHVLVNPNGNVVSFNKDAAGTAQFEKHLYMQRPPHVKRPEQWYREPTAEELARFIKDHPF